MHYDGLPLAGLRIADSTGGAAGYCIAGLSKLGAEVIQLRPDIDTGTARAILRHVDAWIHCRSIAQASKWRALARRSRRQNRQRIDLELHGGNHPSVLRADLVLQAAGGMLFLNGAAEDPPLPGFGQPAYDCVVAYSALALLLARYAARRDRNHRQHIVVDAAAAVAATIEHLGSSFFDAGVIPRRTGHHWSGNFHVAPTSDGHVLVTSQCDTDILTDWMIAEGAYDPTSANAADGDLLAATRRWAATRPAADIERAALERGLPLHRLATPSDLRQHPQLLARNLQAIRAPQPRPSRDATHVGARRRSRLPLAGVRVLDFSWVVAGPLATRVLADAGAEIVRIEAPHQRTAAETEDGIPGRLNRDKKSVVIDMATDDGQRLAKDLAHQCDVVLANFRPRVLQQWGFTEEQLRCSHPQLITLCMSAFGASGPWSNVPGFGPTLHAAVGYDRAMTRANGSPCGWGFSYSDMTSGCAAATAVVAALLRREQTGIGEFIDLAQFDHLARLLLSTTESQEDDRPWPSGVYQCADEPQRRIAQRWVALVVLDANQRQRLCRLVGVPTLEVNTLNATVRRSAETAIGAWLRPQSVMAAVEQLKTCGIPAAVVADAQDLCDPNSPLRLQAYWSELTDRTGRLRRVESLPFRIRGNTLRPQRPAPLPGEHTTMVLHDWLGLDGAGIAALHARGVVASTAPVDEERFEQQDRISTP